jgi:hypothetical protein
MSATTADPIELLTTEQVAARTGLSVSKLLKDRKRRRGLPFLRLGNRTVRYRTVDVELYLAALRGATDKPPALTRTPECPAAAHWDHPALRSGGRRFSRP